MVTCFIFCFGLLDKWLMRIHVDWPFVSILIVFRAMNTVAVSHTEVVITKNVSTKKSIRSMQYFIAYDWNIYNNVFITRKPLQPFCHTINVFIQSLMNIHIHATIIARHLTLLWCQKQSTPRRVIHMIMHLMLLMLSYSKWIIP